MEELPKRSTDISYEEGNRVKTHLLEGLPNHGFRPDFEYQGSVPCNTHIKYHSDIDLLVIIDKFETFENANRITHRYLGNPIEDLINLRAACIKILKENYTVADIEKNSKSITISGGSLCRHIDVYLLIGITQKIGIFIIKTITEGFKFLIIKLKKEIKTFLF